MVLEYFTPGTGFAGGALIGLASAALLLFSGDIMGASGICSTVFISPQKAVTHPSETWKLVFLAVFALLTNTVLGYYFTDDERLGTDPSIPLGSVYAYLMAGFFVGFGTKLANGCTTGHGICGMPRLSVRSIAAVCTFMGSALAGFAVISPDNKAFSKGTAFLRTDEVPTLYNRWLGFGISMIVVVPALIAVTIQLRKSRRQQGSSSPTGDIQETSKSETHSETNKSDTTDLEVGEKGQESLVVLDADGASDADKAEENTDAAPTDYGSIQAEKESPAAQSNADDNCDFLRKVGPACLSSVLFAVGLAVSQMVLPSKVMGFLALYTIPLGTYDPTLLCVMIGGAAVSFVSYQFVSDWAIISNKWALKTPIACKKFSVPTNCQLDWQLFTGSLFFGLGWALVGLCPGPAMFLAASGAKPVVFFWWPMFIVGSFLAHLVKERFPVRPCSN